MPSEEATGLRRVRDELRGIRSIVDLLPAMVAYWNTDQRCVFANRAYEMWFGVKPAELLGRTLEELLGPIYPLNKPFIEGALRGEPQQFEREIPDPYGGPSRYSQALYMPDVDGARVLGFAVLVSDITHRKKMEDELRAARQSAEDALSRVRTLQGLLPICAWCRKLRDDQGYWSDLEQFLQAHTEAHLTHGICEECAAKVERGE